MASSHLFYPVPGIKTFPTAPAIGIPLRCRHQAVGESKGRLNKYSSGPQVSTDFSPVLTLTPALPMLFSVLCVYVFIMYAQMCYRMWRPEASVRYFLCLLSETLVFKGVSR